MKKVVYSFFLFVFSVLGFSSSAQVQFKLQLLQSNDSLAIPYASVKDLKTSKVYLSNLNGEVLFTFNKLPKQLKLAVSFIGNKGIYEVQINHPSEQQLFLHKKTFQLAEAAIKGLTAKDIMLKVVKQIPENYLDSSFLLLGNYRQFQQINGKYKNLIEAQMGIASQLTRNENELKAKESFAIIQMRRSHYYYPIDGNTPDDINDLMLENPIYHLMRNSLNPKAFDEYEFEFDTNSFFSKKEYIIHYRNKSLPVERHSIDGYEYGYFSGEAREQGTFVVSKENFALLELERNSIRNPQYSYPMNNNYVLPSKRYTIEFKGAHLKMKFDIKDGKYFLKELYHQYSHDFFDAKSGVKRYFIQDFFEWNSVLATRVLPIEMKDDFYETTALPLSNYTYEPAAWSQFMPYSFYVPIEVLYHEMGKVIPLEIQFKQQTTEYEK